MQNSGKFFSTFFLEVLAAALTEACNLRVTSPAACRLTYVHFAGEITHGMISLLRTVASIFLTNCGSFCVQEQGFCMLFAAEIACVQLVNLTVKVPKFSTNLLAVAGNLCAMEVLSTETKIISYVFTDIRLVTLKNCMPGLLQEVRR